MLFTTKGQVTIPKHIREAAGVVPGSEVSFHLDGSRIVITAKSRGNAADKRTQLRQAASKVRQSFSDDFRQLDANAIMAFLRPENTLSK